MTSVSVAIEGCVQSEKPDNSGTGAVISVVSRPTRQVDNVVTIVMRFATPLSAQSRVARESREDTKNVV